jgi:AraC-like DNA-binding protein
MMSRALAVYHGSFGRATLYELDRPMTTHAHREGHLILHLRGEHAAARVNGRLSGISDRWGVAINPWEPHGFIPSHRGEPSLFLVLYIDRAWFQRIGRSDDASFHFGRPDIQITPHIRAIMRKVVALLEDFDTSANFNGTLFELANACFEQSWRLAGGWHRCGGPTISFVDYRVRKSIVLMSEQLGSDIELDQIACRAGLSRPHFYKLFRLHTGVTPNIYLNTLRMEKAVERVAASDRLITDIGDELGFSCQSVFTRFFTSHVGMAPSDYRRAVQVLPS